MDIDQKRIDLRNAEEKTQEPNFWDNPDKAREQLRKVAANKAWVDDYDVVAKDVAALGLMPAFVKLDNVLAKLPAHELVTIANTSVRFALTLFSFNILYAFWGSLTMIRRIPYSEVSATVAAMMRMRSSANNANISLNFPYLFSRKIEI